ncbi:nucleotidyltransferase family protein [Sphingopyxis sp. SE2]|uniref:nucleotidyltransferase family protein n=1 Tax=unclassified Sphingopyxis TaxID=2614943 RepID=UPI00050E8290|nr:MULTISPECIES: nucleotidyltransferase family protein [unclassified Sphingopyxis]KGB56528.1 4-diphosphocytidyl-2C-methyl-D-erythritol synthase [Sphingopyxis sp. LC363]MDT7529354.1 nucleotidyltransferase family protein [Sphingopyxis sp. SE2]
MSAPIPAIVLAGSRPGPDPLLSGSGVSTKALLSIAGRPMLVHVVDALRNSPFVGPITILAQNSAELAAEPDLADFADLHFADSGQGISSSLAAALPPGDDPLLVTTADNVLLTPTMIAEFLRDAEESDVAVAMVEREVLLARYPQSKRTWLKFRGGWWSGANMFRLRGRRVLPLLDFWGRIERDRKKGLKIVAAFGPWLLLGALLRLFTIQQGIARAGLRFGLKARVVPMSEPEACIDADKPADIELIEAIFAARRQDAIGRPL